MQAFAQEVEPLRVAQRQLVRMLGLLDRHCIVDLTLAQGHTLVEVDAAGRMTISDLAEKLGVDLSVASRTASSLVRAGLLHSVKSKTDGRARDLTLTSLGRDRLRELNVRAASQADHALALLSDEERRQILHGVQLYAKALEKSRRLEGVRIRPCRQKDNAAVADTIRKVMTEYGAVGEGYSINDPEVAAMYEAYAEPRSVLKVVEKDAVVIGLAAIAPLAGGDPATCELRKMYFLPSARGLGLGRQMLSALLDEARSLGYRRCYLESLEHMHDARKLYESMGFKYLDAPMGCTGHGRCNVWMSLEL